MIDVELCGELVSRCFQARTDTHVAHLLTESYAAHKALNEFYDEIVDLADGFAESAQGRAGKFLSYCNCKMDSTDNPTKLVTNLRTWIDDNRKDCTDESSLQNIIDEIVDLCNSTIYKLRFLK